MSEFCNTKVRIRNEKECESVQLAMFKRGFKWASGEQEIVNLDAKCLYFYKDFDICSGNDEDYFLRNPKIEVSVEDILGELINNKMDNVSILKEFDKKALIDAKKEISLERAEKQKEKAKEILRSIMDEKDKAEEVIKSTTESLSEIDESLKIFNKK